MVGSPPGLSRMHGCGSCPPVAESPKEPREDDGRILHGRQSGGGFWARPDGATLPGSVSLRWLRGSSAWGRALLMRGVRSSITPCYPVLLSL